MGKTHLMHAIGQYLLNQNDHLELTYISSERFMNEMINPVRYDRILEFRERYRTIDLLLVDDIQSLTNNSLPQDWEEFWRKTSHDRDSLGDVPVAVEI